MLFIFCFAVGLVGLAFGFWFREFRNILYSNGSQKNSRVITGSDEQWVAYVNKLTRHSNIAYSVAALAFGILIVFAQLR